MFLMESFLATFIDIWQLFTGHTGYVSYKTIFPIHLRQNFDDNSLRD